MLFNPTIKTLSVYRYTEVQISVLAAPLELLGAILSWRIVDKKYLQTWFDSRSTF
nr:MAG TPA: hypothetical protein [Caudoviricetes sp.]